MHEASNNGHSTVPPQLRSAIAKIEGDGRIDAVVGPLERAAAPVSKGGAASALRGEWLGHALHPLLTDLPLGCWLSAGVLDVIGGRGSRKSAQRLIGIGLLSVPITAASGLSDWSALKDPRTRRVGAVHAVGNGVAAYVYYRSWRARRRGHHLRGMALSLVGGAGAAATGYLGAHMSYARRAGTGERGLGIEGDSPVETSVTDVDVAEASRIIGVPVPQVEAMVEEGMLDPVATWPALRFREADVQAVRLLGS